MALFIVSEGGVDAMTLCLGDFSIEVKEAAAWTVGYVSRHNACLAKAVVDVGNFYRYLVHRLANSCC